MNLGENTKYVIFIIRIVIGWMFAWAGWIKISDATWSAAGYINNALTFPAFYDWLALPSNIGWVNLANEWGLLIIGLALIVGFKVRLASLFGGLMMLLYYFPVLDFPYIPSVHGFIVNRHVIYMMALALLYQADAGYFMGLDNSLVIAVKK